MAVYDQPSKEVFNAYKAGQGKGLLGMASIPLPSITGGAAAPALSNTAPTTFGNVTLGGGLSFIQTVALAGLGMFLIWRLVK